MIKNNSVINLVLLFCDVRTGNFGSGTHLSSLLPFLKNQKGISLHIIHTDDKKVKVLGLEEHEDIHALHIPQPENKLFLTASQDPIQKTYARRLTEIIYPFVKELDNLVFWANSADYLNLCFELKGNLDCQLLYVHHSWSWKAFNNIRDKDFAHVFYSGNHQGFETAVEFTRYQQTLAMLADRVVTVTNQATIFFSGILGVPVSKITTIYNGIKHETNFFSNEKTTIRKKLGIGGNEKVILYTGRIRADKGLAYLIEGFKAALETIPNCRLVLVGKGDFEEFIPMTYPYSSRVTFTGKLEWKALSDWYKITDVGLMPSLHEQCSFTAIEMRFYQIPLIVSSVDGLDEMFLHEYDALKLNIRYDEKGEKILDPEQISAFIVRLVSDRILASHLTQNGLKEAQERFTAERMWSGYLKVLEKMTNDFDPINI